MKFKWIWDQEKYNDGKGYMYLTQYDGGSVNVSVGRLKFGKHLKNGQVVMEHQPISPIKDESGCKNDYVRCWDYCICGFSHSKGK